MEPEKMSPETAVVRQHMPYKPHDLLWLNGFDALVSEDVLPSWVNDEWSPGLPVVVRRDHSGKGLIPAGIRGKDKSQRAAIWIHPENIVRSISPDSLATDREMLERSPFVTSRPVRAMLGLMELNLPFIWGPTGSCAFALATGKPVMHESSDLDLQIRCPEPVLPDCFARLVEKCKNLPCRTDIQIETPWGAFALKEWIRENGTRVLLKTNRGPVLTTDPWSEYKDNP